MTYNNTFINAKLFLAYFLVLAKRTSPLFFYHHEVKLKNSLSNNQFSHRAQSCISCVRQHRVATMNEKYVKWCKWWTHCLQSTGVGVTACPCSRFWKKNLVSSSVSFSSDVMLCVCVCLFLGVGHSRLTEKEHMATWCFRWLQRLMFYFWREQTMFEEIHWMLLMFFSCPSNPKPSPRVYSSRLSQRLHMSDVCSRQKAGNEGRKRGRNRERKLIDFHLLNNGVHVSNISLWDTVDISSSCVLLHWFQ